MSNNLQNMINTGKFTKRTSISRARRRWVPLRSRVRAESIPPNAGFEEAHHFADEQSNTCEQLRIFVGTWNVAGKRPREGRVMQEWLGSQEPADIYVIGFQEIVPLNVQNVLGNVDDGAPAREWDEFIMNALNRSSLDVSTESSCWSSESLELACPARTSFNAMPYSPSFIDGSMFQGWGDHCLSCGGSDITRRHSSVEENCYHFDWNSCYSVFQTPAMHSPSSNMMAGREYVQVARKQMVGLFISVWIRQDLRRCVRAVGVSAVGCGIMGRFGNKGSVSVSLTLLQTRFCFICSHLSSGDRPNNATRRNADVKHILHRTRFHRSNTEAAFHLPETILGHDRIIWFGDLNYRLSLPFEELKSLVAMADWQALLMKDQLREEQERGVLQGWNEGPITFRPTYKFAPNSNSYILMKHPPPPHTNAQRRAPAWCDRILWYGKGLKQLCYASTDSLWQSDHRPVSAVFTAGLETWLDP